MGNDRSRTVSWSVFGAVKNVPASSETLMAEIDAAVAALEYDHASTLLASSSSYILPSPAAGEAYRGACAALAMGLPDAAIKSICVVLSSCPPGKTSAIAKPRSVSSASSASSISSCKLRNEKSQK